MGLQRRKQAEAWATKVKIMAKYIVTGGAGFIGSNIVRELVRRGESVKVIDNLSTGHRENLEDLMDKIEFVKADIGDLEALQKEFKGADYVLHQAALCSVPRSIDNPINSNDANVAGTLNVLTAARDNKIKRVVYASSSSVYGDITTPAKIEEERGKILSPYALTKLAGEIYCQLFYELYGLETVVLRYFNVFGPSQDPESQYAAVIPLFIKAALNNESPVIFGDGVQSRDFTYVANNVEANILAATRPGIAGEVFNIACNTSISLNELVAEINHILGKNIKPVFKPRRSGDIKHSKADITKAKTLMGYEPKVSFREGLKKTVRWYIDNSKGKSQKSKLKEEKLSIAVVGLGYVGLPLAVEFAKKGVKVIGFDINEKRISALKLNIDESQETSSEDLKLVPIDYSSDPKVLQNANFIIVAVPTPVTAANQPDLNLVEAASKIVGQNLSRNTTVVYESTVYPGVTEEICVPIIEQESSLKCGKDWFVGYSPERVNPGDQKHTIAKITKIVSGADPKTLEKIAQVYEIICEAGVYSAPDIKTAEAAKVIENTQRDINIGLMNELSLLFHRLDIDTQEVLKAAGTKWNFLKFRPGLVGGHCIGVDPYYLVYKAEEVGLHPQVIIAGRRVNDYMAEFVADEVVKGLIQTGQFIQKAKILVMGLTFKENIRDTRNSKISLTIKRLKELGVKVYGFDPNLNTEELKTFGVFPLARWTGKFEGIIVGVGHREFQGLEGKIGSVLLPKGVLMDIPALYPELKHKKNIIYKTL